MCDHFCCVGAILWVIISSRSRRKRWPCENFESETNDNPEGEGEPRRTGTIVADFVDHSLQVGGWLGRMECNGDRYVEATLPGH